MSSPAATTIFVGLASPAAEVQCNGQVYDNGNGVRELHFYFDEL